MKKSLVGQLLMGLILVTIALVCLLCIVPPISRDALVHHLAVPRIYLEFGRMVELPCMSYSYFPMNLDLLYMIPLYFGNDIAPKFIHFAFGLMTAWLIYWYLKRRLNRNYGLFGVFLFLSLPIVIKLSITVYVDLGLTFFSFAGLILIFEWIRSGFGKRYIVSSAVCCGLAMGTKYNALPVFVILSLFVPFLYSRFNEESAAQSAKAIAWGAMFVLISLAVFSPWMVRNYVWKGNPIYPLYNKYFTIKNENPCPAHEGIRYPESMSINVFKKRELFYGEGPMDLALLPVRIFFQGRDNDFQHFDGSLSALLFFLPLVLLVPLKGRDPSAPPDTLRHERIGLFVFAVFVFLIAIFSTSVRIRYFLPSVPCMVVLSVFGLKRLNTLIEKRMKGAGAANARILLCGAIAVYMGIHNVGYLKSQFNYVRPMSYLSGQVSRSDYIAQFRNEYPALTFINEHLPEDAVVLFFFNGKRGYYCHRQYIPDEGRSLDLIHELIRNLGQPELIRKEILQRGITHLLMNHKFVKDRVDEDFEPEERRIFLDFMNQQTDKIYEQYGYSLYALKL